MLKGDGNKWKRANKQKRLRANIKKQTISPLQETDNIYRQLVKGKPQIDNLHHGLQLDEFKQALLRICMLAEKQFIEFGQAHEDYVGNRPNHAHSISWKARYDHGRGNGDADGNKVAAFDGLMVYLDIPAGKYGNAGNYQPERDFIRDKETEKRFREIMEKRRRLLPPRKIKAGKNFLNNFTYLF